MLKEKRPRPAACPNARVIPETNETSWNADPNKFDFRDGTKPPIPTLTKTLLTERLTMKVNRPNREPNVYTILAATHGWVRVERRVRRGHELMELKP